MGRVLPILFNTDMVRAILDGRKTVTRHVIRYKYSNTEMKMRTDKYGTRLIEIQKDIEGETHGKNPDGSTWHKLLPYIEKNPPYRKSDTLYVRETWREHSPGFDNLFIYKADYAEGSVNVKWHPSIHMPKKAARIWLKVTDVRVERLQDITPEQVIKEGTTEFDREHLELLGEHYDILFAALWDSTIKKSDMAIYSWKSNPWVWVIEFERCGKPETKGDGQLEDLYM